MEKPKAFETLTWAVINRFIGRKQSNILSVLCDTDADLIYPVPVDTEHIDWAAAVLGSTPALIRQNPASAAHLVPVVIELSPTLDEVRGMLTGTSGMEIGFRVRHTKEQLEKAHAMAAAFVFRGELPVSEETFHQDIVRRWQA